MREEDGSTGVVIVGAGHAGGRTAERLRAGGFSGPIDVVGAERELPYERPPLSKNVLTAPELPANAYILPAARWTELGVHFHLNTSVSLIDRQRRRVLLAGGTELAYRHLVLATGLTARRVDALEPVQDRVLSLRSFEDASVLRPLIGPGTLLLLVGAGLIGLEVAASAVQLGAAVTIVEAGERPASRMLPSWLSKWIGDLHRSAGVHLLCGRQVVTARETGSAASITLDDGTRMDASAILVGIGGVPNDSLAQEAGLDVANGILVNAFCQTSDPSILAVGDVASHANPTFGTRWRLESWRNAEDQARVAAAFICGSPLPYDEVPWFWTDQYGLNLQIAGVLGDALPSLERGGIGTSGYLAYFLCEGRLRGAFGIGCGRDIRVAREMIKAGGTIDTAELARKGFVARAPVAFVQEGIGS